MTIIRKANETWKEFYQRKWDAHPWSHLDPQMPDKLVWLANIVEMPVNRDLCNLLMAAKSFRDFFTVVFCNPSMKERVRILENLLDPDCHLSGAAMSGIWMDTCKLLRSRQRERVW